MPFPMSAANLQLCPGKMPGVGGGRVVTDASETVIRIWTLIGSSSLESLAGPPTQPSKSVGRTGMLSHRLPPKIPTLGSGFPQRAYFVVMTFLVDGWLINKTRVSKTWLNFKHKVTS